MVSSMVKKHQPSNETQRQQLLAAAALLHSRGTLNQQGPVCEGRCTQSLPMGSEACDYGTNQGFYLIRILHPQEVVAVILQFVN